MSTSTRAKLSEIINNANRQKKEVRGYAQYPQSPVRATLIQELRKAGTARFMNDAIGASISTVGVTEPIDMQGHWRAVDELFKLISPFP